MCNPNQLFAELFFDPSREEVALFYLSALMGETECAEEFYKKARQVSLLKEFFANDQRPGCERYLQWVKDIESILEGERIANGWVKLDEG